MICSRVQRHIPNLPNGCVQRRQEAGDIQVYQKRERHQDSEDSRRTPKKYVLEAIDEDYVLELKYGL